MANLFFRTNVAPYRIDTYNALHEKLGCEFYFLYKEDGSQKFDMQKQYEQCKFKVNFLDSISLLGKRSQKFCTNIWGILNENNPEVVIVPEFKILSLQVLLHKWIFRKKYKVICMTDDSYSNLVGKTATKLHLWAQKILAPKMDNFLLVDTKVVDWYKQNYGRGIWLPIIRDEQREIPLYESVLPLSRTFVKQHNLENKKVLLFLARLEPVKNVTRMLEAIAKTTEDFVTIIVGSGSLEEELKHQAEQISKPIIFAGRYEGDGVRAWYNVADVFILPSTWEPFGAVTNEALLSGCKCLISDVSGSTCLIDDTNGKTFNPYDIDAMANVIDKTMKETILRKDIINRPCKMSFTFDETMDRVINDLKK